LESGRCQNRKCPFDIQQAEEELLFDEMTENEYKLKVDEWE